MGMRVVFFGTADFAVPSLTALVEARVEVVACVTQPDRPQGRGQVPQASPVKRTALRHGLAVRQPERVGVAALSGLVAEAGVVAAYGQLIPAGVLARFPQGLLGVHPSLLPAYRGAAPVARAIMDGRSTTGVTIFRLDERLDAGAILDQHPVTIEPGEDAQQLTDRLAEEGAALLVRTLRRVAEGETAGRPQDERHASTAPKLTKADGWIDWHQPAEQIDRLVRAVVPWPGAQTVWQGRRLIVWRASAQAAAPCTVAPGTVAAVAGSGITVASGRGLVTITELQPAGGRRMSARDFLAGHPVRLGDRLDAGGEPPRGERGQGGGSDVPGRQ
jgi:methionyl-tRNA formyltransferase